MIDHVSLHNATGCRCKYKHTSIWKCTRVFPLVSYWSFIGPSATHVASYPHTNSYPHRSQVNTQTYKLHSQCTVYLLCGSIIPMPALMSVFISVMILYCISWYDLICTCGLSSVLWVVYHMPLPGLSCGTIIFSYLYIPGPQCP